MSASEKTCSVPVKSSRTSASTAGGIPSTSAVTVTDVIVSAHGASVISTTADTSGRTCTPVTV